MTDDLSQNESDAVDVMPATSREISDELNIGMSYVWDIVGNIRDKGYSVSQDSEGRYYVAGDPPTDSPSAHTEARQTSANKASITRDVKEYLSELEDNLLQSLQDTEPAVAEMDPNPGNQDLIIHRTDDHFGELTTNQHGDEVFNSEIAEARVREVFSEAFEEVDARREAGIEFDGAHLLLGGDIITGEAIYDGQAHEIDETLQDQISRATDVYLENIRRLSEEFDYVQVVCQQGNHGRLGHGNPSNADNVLYMALDKLVRESEMENVEFVQSHQSYYVDFQIRDWNVHLRHGHDSSLEHIGTSAGKQRWLSWLVDHGFDLAFRGHYHLLKEEPINGRPVVMGGSIVPQTEFEESHALSGRAMAAVHGISDEYPLEWTSRITFE